MDLGAVYATTGEYCRPDNASKDRTYNCPDCQERLILRRGEITDPAPSFAVKLTTAEPPTSAKRSTVTVMAFDVFTFRLF